MCFQSQNASGRTSEAGSNIRTKQPGCCAPPKAPPPANKDFDTSKGRRAIPSRGVQRPSQPVIPSVASNPPIRGGPEQTSSPRQCALHRDRNPQPTTHNPQHHSILSNAHRQRTRCSLLPLYPHRHGCHPDGLSRFEIPCRTTSDDQLLILTQPHHHPANHHHKEEEHSSIHSGSSPEHLPPQGHSCLATTADTGPTCPNTSPT